MMIRDLDVVSFLWHNWLNDQHICARIWGILTSGKIYLWKFQRNQKSGQYVLPLSDALITRPRKRALSQEFFTGRGEGRKTRGLSYRKKPQIHSKFPDDHVETFRKATSCGRKRTTIRGPDKLSVLARLAKAASLASCSCRKWIKVISTKLSLLLLGSLPFFAYKSINYIKKYILHVKSIV